MHKGNQSKIRNLKSAIEDPAIRNPQPLWYSGSYHWAMSYAMRHALFARDQLCYPISRNLTINSAISSGIGDSKVIISPV